MTNAGTTGNTPDRSVRLGWGLRGWLDALPRTSLYPVVGFVLAMGAPGGLLLLRVLWSTQSPFQAAWAAVASEPGTFAYVAISTGIAFAVLGRLLGHTVDRLRETAITDPLTGLHNRRHLHARLASELHRALRYHSPVAFLLVDVDELKRINDTHGHEAGDAAILAVARALERTCRVTDVSARFGGDEFAVVAPGVRADGALELADRIRASLRGLSDPALPSPPTVSIGVTDVQLAGPRPESMYSAADAALYEAKARGRDRAVISTPNAELRQSA